MRLTKWEEAVEGGVLGKAASLSSVIEVHVQRSICSNIIKKEA